MGVELKSRTGQELDDALVALGFVSHDDIATFISLNRNVPFIKFDKTKIEPEAIKLIPETIARKYCAVPVSIAKDGLLVAMKDIDDLQAIEDMAIQARMRIKPAIAITHEIQTAIELSYKSCSEIEREVRKIPDHSAKAGARLSAEELAETPVVRVIDLMMAQAVKDRASDIHIEPQDLRAPGPFPD